MLGKTYNEEASSVGITQLKGTWISPTKAEVHILHIIKKFRSLEKQLGKINTGQDIKDVSKDPEFLYKKHNTKCVFIKKRDVPRYYRT
jgi:hypothetical protein